VEDGKNCGRESPTRRFTVLFFQSAGLLKKTKKNWTPAMSKQGMRRSRHSSVSGIVPRFVYAIFSSLFVACAAVYM
jgi:hypothetical protein